MIIIGIDPGLDGGIAILDGSQQPLVYKTPVIAGKEYDIQGMKIILAQVRARTDNVIAFIENQISMPGQGLTSTLQTGKGFGIWIGLLAGLNVPYQIIGAQAWQKKLFTGLKGTLDTKAKSEIIAKRLFPSVDFRKSDRSRVANDGLTDAILIAEYGKRMTGGEPEPPPTGRPHSPLPKSPDICMNCGVFIPNAREDDCKQLTIFQ